MEVCSQYSQLNNALEGRCTHLLATTHRGRHKTECLTPTSAGKAQAEYPQTSCGWLQRFIYSSVPLSTAVPTGKTLSCVSQVKDQEKCFNLFLK